MQWLSWLWCCRAGACCWRCTVAVAPDTVIRLHSLKTAPALQAQTLEPGWQPRLSQQAGSTHRMRHSGRPNFNLLIAASAGGTSLHTQAGGVVPALLAGQAMGIEGVETLSSCGGCATNGRGDCSTRRGSCDSRGGCSTDDTRLSTDDRRHVDIAVSTGEATAGERRDAAPRVQQEACAAPGPSFGAAGQPEAARGRQTGQTQRAHRSP